MKIGDKVVDTLTVNAQVNEGKFLAIFFFFLCVPADKDLKENVFMVSIPLGFRCNGYDDNSEVVRDRGGCARGGWRRILARANRDIINNVTGTRFAPPTPTLITQMVVTKDVSM